MIENTFNKVMESRGKKSVSAAMRESEYPSTTARNPQQVTRSKTWGRLLKQHLPDTLLTERHKELLNKREVIIIHKGTISKVELTDQPHSDVKQALDMAYKLKDKYPKQQQAGPFIPIQINFAEAREEFK